VVNIKLLSETVVREYPGPGRRSRALVGNWE